MSYGTIRALRVGVRSMAGYPALGAVFVAAALAQGVLQAAVIWVMRDQLLNLEAAGSPAAGSLAAGALLIFAVWLLRCLCTFAGQAAQGRLAARVEVSTMQTVLARLLKMSLRFFEQNSKGDLVMAAHQDLRAVRGVTLHVATILLTLSRIGGLAAAAWLISPKLAAIGLVALPLGMVPAYWLGQKVTAAARGERTARVTLHDNFLQLSSGIRVIKASRSEGRILAAAERIGRRYYDESVRQSEGRSVARVLLDVVSGLGVIAVLVTGGRDVGLGILSWPDLLALLVAMMAVYAPILSLLSVIGQIRTLIPSLERVDEILATPPAIADVVDARPLTAAPRTIDLEHVGFSYDNGTMPALADVSATFHQGETIGIVGPSGSGKSTLVALMLRLYEPTTGRILYDGHDLRQYRQADLAGISAVVVQDPVLFADTIANNIRWARPDAGMDEVVRAAKAAMVHDEIVAMKDGYDTMLGGGARGQDVSVGQRQRVAIAAALLKDPPMLFLDEALRGLDSTSERAVQAAIDRLMSGRTTFVVTHRPSRLTRVDRVLVLDRGRVAAIGTHAHLLETSSAYRRACAEA